MHLKINRDMFSFSLLSLFSLPPLLLSLLSLPTSSLSLSFYLSYLPSLSVQFVLTKTCLTEEVLSSGGEEDKGEGRSGVVEGKRERRTGVKEGISDAVFLCCSSGLEHGALLSQQPIHWLNC